MPFRFQDLLQDSHPTGRGPKETRNGILRGAAVCAEPNVQHRDRAVATAEGNSVKGTHW